MKWPTLKKLLETAETIGKPKTTAYNLLTYPHRYPTTSPTKIQVGDLVEVQMSFVMFPVRGGEYKFSSLLRSVTLMDKCHTEASGINIAFRNLC